jgi:hypothetical protein
MWVWFRPGQQCQPSLHLSTVNCNPSEQTFALHYKALQSSSRLDPCFEMMANFSWLQISSMARYKPNITIAHDLRQVPITFLRFFFFFGFFKMETFSMFGEPLTQNFKTLVNHLLRLKLALPSCLSGIFN